MRMLESISWDVSFVLVKPNSRIYIQLSTTFLLTFPIHINTAATILNSVQPVFSSCPLTVFSESTILWSIIMLEI